MKKQYGFSFYKDEGWVCGFDSFEEALEEARRCRVFDECLTHVYIAEAVPADYTPTIDAEDIIYHIQDAAYNVFAGANDYVNKLNDEDFLEELDTELNAVFQKLLKKYDIKPDWYYVKGEKLYSLD